MSCCSAADPELLATSSTASLPAVTAQPTQALFSPLNKSCWLQFTLLLKWLITSS